MRLLPNPSEVWRRNHPWAPLYAFALNHPPLAIAGGVVVMGTDMRLLYRAIAQIGELPDGAAVLDVPCGGGVALRGLGPEQDVRYVAADIAEPMLERTAREAERLGLLQVRTQLADVAALPFADGEFDLVVSFTGLHCFPDPRAAVGELARVTKPGGRITGSLVLTDGGPDQKLRVVLGRASGLMGPSATEAQIRSWLPAAGFAELRLVRSGGMGYFTATRA